MSVNIGDLYDAKACTHCNSLYGLEVNDCHKCWTSKHFRYVEVKIVDFNDSF